MRRDYTPAEIENRLRKLDRLGKRCDANGRKCLDTATVQYTVYLLDPATKERKSDETDTRCACSRHKPLYTRSALYEIVGTRSLKDDNGDATYHRPSTEDRQGNAGLPAQRAAVEEHAQRRGLSVKFKPAPE